MPGIGPADQSLPSPHSPLPLPGEQRRWRLSWGDLGESLRLSSPPVALQPGGLPLPQLSCHLPAFPPNRAGGEGPPPSRAGSASSRPPGMGELGDLGPAGISLQHLAHWSLAEEALGDSHTPGTVRAVGHQTRRPEGWEEGPGHTGIGAVGCQVVDAPCPGPTHWHTPEPRTQAGGPVAVSSSGGLRQFPASRPLPLPMEPDAALWKIPSGVCCLSPPSRHPQWGRCVRIQGKSLHKY